MLITYHGHSEFYLECANGFCLLTDPYDDHVGYPMGTYRADAVTVTHGHGDHSFIQKATGAPAIIDSAGEWHPAPEVKITAIPSVHDDANGEKRGKNLIMKMEMEGLTLVHMGDQGAPLTKEQMAALGKIDVLMIPVGGFYTIDAAAAYDMVRALKPRITIPMHYKGTGFGYDVIGRLGDYTRLCQDVKEYGSELAITKEMEKQTAVLKAVYRL